MIETDVGYFSTQSDAVRILLKEPRPCACGHMVCFVVNRDGKSRCVQCDVEYQEALCRVR